MKFYYTYVLLSKNDLKYYYGYTENLKLRIEYILLTFLGARKIHSLKNKNNLFFS